MTDRVVRPARWRSGGLVQASGRWRQVRQIAPVSDHAQVAGVGKRLVNVGMRFANACWMPLWPCVTTVPRRREPIRRRFGYFRPHSFCRRVWCGLKVPGNILPVHCFRRYSTRPLAHDTRRHHRGNYAVRCDRHDAIPHSPAQLGFYRRHRAHQ